MDNIIGLWIILLAIVFLPLAFREPEKVKNKNEEAEERKRIRETEEKSRNLRQKTKEIIPQKPILKDNVKVNFRQTIGGEIEIEYTFSSSNPDTKLYIIKSLNEFVGADDLEFKRKYTVLHKINFNVHSNFFRKRKNEKGKETLGGELYHKFYDIPIGHKYETLYYTAIIVSPVANINNVNNRKYYNFIVNTKEFVCTSTPNPIMLAEEQKLRYKQECIAQKMLKEIEQKKKEEAKKLEDLRKQQEKEKLEAKEKAEKERKNLNLSKEYKTFIDELDHQNNYDKFNEKVDLYIDNLRQTGRYSEDQLEVVQ